MASFSHLSSHHSPSPLPLTTPILLTPPHTIPHYHFFSLPSPLFTPMHSPPPPLYNYPTTPHYFPSLHPLTTPLTTPSRYPLSPPLTTPYHPSPLLTYPPHHTSSPPSSPLSSSPTFLTTHLFTTLFTPHPTTLKRDIITPKDS